jgi:hypothetical protein
MRLRHSAKQACGGAGNERRRRPHREEVTRGGGSPGDGNSRWLVWGGGTTAWFGRCSIPAERIWAAAAALLTWDKRQRRAVEKLVQEATEAWPNGAARWRAGAEAVRNADRRLQLEGRPVLRAAECSELWSSTIMWRRCDAAGGVCAQRRAAPRLCGQE